MPYVRINDGSIFDLLSAPKFHLVCFTNNAGSTPQLDGRLAELADSATVPITIDVTVLFGTDEPFTVLLRPDNHIAGIWSGHDVQPGARWLAALFETSRI